MNSPASPNDRDRIVDQIASSVRSTIRDLVYAGKDPDAVGRLLAHTLGSMRALASHLAETDTAPTLSDDDVQEVQAVITMIPEDVRPLFDAGILAGAHPLSYARRVQDMITAAMIEEPAA
jgi:hypothetical protein